ncbi:MAG: GNAT family N-acetyltransferase [Longimicrobiaceae bacterium]
MTPPVRVRELAPDESLTRFIDLSWRFNADDPHWIAPLRMTLRTVLNRRKHPFHQHAEVAYFLAERGNDAVGRIAAVVNHAHNDFHDERSGFFGFFECEDDPATAAALLDAAADWLRAGGMERARGPTNLSTNEEASSPGILIDGFDTPPVILMSHNPPYYRRLIEGAGFEKARDLLAYRIPTATPPERAVRGMERILKREGATIRSLDMGRFAQEVATIQRIYNAAWQRNWGFIPMTEAEIRHMAKELKPVVDPALCLFAEVDGKAVGFSLALPDLNQALRHLPSGKLFPFGIFRLLWERRKIDRLRVITLGLEPGWQKSGLGAALYVNTFLRGAPLGYRWAEASWILEDNLEMRRPLEKMGADAYKTYRVYERVL